MKLIIAAIIVMMSASCLPRTGIFYVVSHSTERNGKFCVLQEETLGNDRMIGCYDNMRKAYKVAAKHRKSWVRQDYLNKQETIKRKKK